MFCAIAAGDVVSTAVASSENTYAFRDINPAMPSHVLVISREHISSADTVEAGHAGVLAEMFTTAQAVARVEGLDGRGYRLVFNVGEDAQSSVPHLHMHVLGGRAMDWPPG